MIFPTIPHLILAGLMGIHCKITTVSQVSVKAGDSISIPCLYEQKYVTHVKYLCKDHGDGWPNCKKVVQTNKANTMSGRFSISDDTTQRVFTVAINNVTDADTKFWCAVKKWPFHDKQAFQLSVTTGVSGLYVNQREMTAFEGGSVTAVCHCKNHKESKWCRLGSPSCVEDETGSIDGITVKINTSVPNVFSVTMSELRIESSGWYWCASGDLQMPVHITVYELTSTTATTTTFSPNTTMTHSTTHHQPSSLVTHTEPGGGSLQDEPMSSTEVTIIATTLALLLLIVSSAFFGWRMVKRNKTKPEVCDIPTSAQSPDPDVMYATIVQNQRVTAKEKDHTDSVTYSSIVFKDNMQQTTEPAVGTVIYSTLKYDKP